MGGPSNTECKRRLYVAATTAQNAAVATVRMSARARLLKELGHGPPPFESPPFKVSDLWTAEDRTVPTLKKEDTSRTTSEHTLCTRLASLHRLQSV